MRRIERMERLSVLLRRMQQMRELELQTALRAVSEIIDLQVKEAASSLAEGAISQTALAEGDSQEWMLAEAGRALIGFRMARHRQTRARREDECAVAQAQFTQGRLEREQMERLIDAQRRTAETIETRRLQAGTDDRFLSRREWLRAHGPRASD